ncbi:MAG: hypothetical protein IBJ03_11025 [Gemmatimonadaceae bacterium]|nr:hypothetical protein [Gemmatimonadaceae bacterium]
MVDDGAEIWMSNRELTSGSSTAHVGLDFRAWMNAEDIETAVERGRSAIENFCGVLSASHGAGVGHVTSLWAIDLDERSEDRELAQFFEDIPTLIPNPRIVSEELFGSFLKGATEGTNSLQDSRIARAIAHARQAALTDDLVQQFSQLWLGLESINGRLIEKYSLPTKFVARHCAICNAPMEVFGSSAGITFAVVTLAGSDKKTANHARNIRRSLQHGSGHFYEERVHLPDIVPILHRALIRAIADVLEVRGDAATSLDRIMYILPEGKGEVTVAVTLHGLSVDQLKASIVPPEIKVDVVPPQSEQGVGAQRRRHWGNLIVKVENHSGSWGNVRISFAGRQDPETVPSAPLAKFASLPIAPLTDRG